MTSRIAIITNGNYFSRLILEDVFNNPEIEICCVIVITGDYKARSGLRALLALSFSTAFPYLIYKVFLYVIFKVAKIFFRWAKFGVVDLLEGTSIPLKFALDVNSDNVKKILKKVAPDLLISVSCPQQVSVEILEIPTVNSINIHSSLLPKYAGLAPYYWVLCNGEKLSGTTVHYMSPKLDEGNILVQSKIEVPPGISTFQLFRTLALEGRKILPEAVKLALQRHPGYKQESSERSYYSLPTLRSYLKLKTRGHSLLKFGEILSVFEEELQRSKIDVLSDEEKS
ncbi:MAG: formyltransferase family protein [Bacillota bacterium]|nr:formyltransferase family protein [Bacillota bacterium]